MRSHKLIFAATAALTIIIFQSCQKSQVNDLQEAQLCLNAASAATAKACVSSIAANTTAFADSLRCSAIFISEGFGSPVSFLDAIESINTSGTGTCTGGCSSTVGALKAFVFTSAGVSTADEKAANNTTAADAFTVCNNSGVKFYAQISSLFKIGTMAAMLAGSATPTADEVKAQLGNLSDTTVGEIVNTTYASVCTDTTNASTATKTYCAELATALASPAATTASIGACLKAKLANPSATCS